MTTSEIKCKKCNSIKVFIEEHGTNTGLYCDECGKWIKWLNKDEVRIVKRYIDNYSLTQPVDNDDENNLEDEDELLFTGMNITDVVLDTMLKTKKNTTNGMTNKELKAYELGVSNTLAFLQVLLCEDDNIVVNTFSKPSEYTYEDLKQYFNSIRYNNKN